MAVLVLEWGYFMTSEVQRVRLAIIGELIVMI
jgi:hypothetical protein